MISLASSLSMFQVTFVRICQHLVFCLFVFVYCGCCCLHCSKAWRIVFVWSVWVRQLAIKFYNRSVLFTIVDFYVWSCWINNSGKNDNSSFVKLKNGIRRRKKKNNNNNNNNKNNNNNRKNKNKNKKRNKNKNKNKKKKNNNKKNKNKNKNKKKKKRKKRYQLSSLAANGWITEEPERWDRTSACKAGKGALLQPLRFIFWSPLAHPERW